MKKCIRIDCCTCPCEQCENRSVAEKKTVDERIYNALDVAEKIAVKLAQINQIIKKEKKKKRRKNKKLGKVDKKTGTIILKKERKAGMLKRHKARKS